MNSAASSPSKKPLAPLVTALAIEAVSIDSASSSQQGAGPLRKSTRCRKRISGNQIGSYFFFAHVKMSHVALQLLQKNLESELY